MSVNGRLSWKMPELELTVAQAARELKVSERTVRYWLKAGKLLGRKVPGKYGDEWRVYADSARVHRSEGRSEGGRDSAEIGVGKRGNEVAALLSEVRSLREETAAYREHLERLTAEVARLREALALALPPGRAEEKVGFFRRLSEFFGLRRARNG